MRLLTRIPVPGTAYDPDWLPRAAKYFPLMGALVGLIAGAVFAASALLWPQPIPALLAVAAGLLVTGAFHEDGLADTADSLGGHDRETRLLIMKDSRIGTFGALALGIVLALKVAALAFLPVPLAAAALAAAGAAGRLAAVLVMGALPYAGDPARAKVELADGDRPRTTELVLACVFGLAPLTFLPPPTAFAAAALGGALAGFVAWRMSVLLGGHTGDVLGAVETTCEAGILLGILAAAGA